MSEAAVAPEGVDAQRLPEAAVAFLSEFHKWALTLPLDDLKQVIPILQTLRAAHVRETDVSRTS